MVKDSFWIVYTKVVVLFPSKDMVKSYLVLYSASEKFVEQVLLGETNRN
jgi:hypothetical protein